MGELSPPRYIEEGALRRVEPYPFEFIAHAKKRWFGRKLVDVLVDEFRGLSRSYYIEAIAEGLVRVNGKRVAADTSIENGDRITHAVTRRELPVYRATVSVLYEDEELLVVDKPPSIPVHECGGYFHNSLIRYLRHSAGYSALFPPHRLDKLTSGLVLLAKTPTAADRLTRGIESGATAKLYLARVAGDMRDATVSSKMKCIGREGMQWGLCPDDDPAGRPSLTHFERVRYNAADDTTLVRCRPISGRTHQIRVHLQSLGHSILNDTDYGGRFVGNGYARYVLFCYSAAESEQSNVLLRKRSEGQNQNESERETSFEDVFSGKPMEIFLHSKSYTADGRVFESGDPYWTAPFLSFPQIERKDKILKE